MKETIQILSDLGVPAGASSIGVVVMYFLHKYREEILIAWNTKSLSARKNLFNHNLFYTINKLSNESIHKIYFKDDPAKTMFLKIFLKCKLEAIDDLSKDMIEKKVFKKNFFKFRHLIKNNCIDIQAKYNLDVYTEYRNKGVPKADIDIVLRKFNYIHSSVIDNLEEQIDSILISRQYRSNYSKLFAVLDIYAFAVRMTFDQANQTFKELNGHFKRINYEQH